MARSYQGRKALITWVGDQVQERQRQDYAELLNQLEGIHTEGVAYSTGSQGDRPHVHALVEHANSKKSWYSKEFIVDGVAPQITAQKFGTANSKAGVWDYLLTQDPDMYRTFTDEDLDKTKKIRKLNEAAGQGIKVQETFVALQQAETLEDVDKLYFEGKLAQNRTSKVWREEWTRMQSVKMAQATHELADITITVPVVFRPGKEEQIQAFQFKFDKTHTLVYTDIKGQQYTVNKKQILHVFGQPGVGKTPALKRTLDSQAVDGVQIYYKIPANTNPMAWFDGYKGEPVIWGDDTVMCSPGQLLNLIEADQLPVKGGFVPKNPTKTIWVFSSNLGFRESFSQYHSPQDKIKVEALYVRTQQVMMNPNPELEETQAPLLIFEGRVIPTKEEYIDLINRANMLPGQVIEIERTREGVLLEEKQEDGTFKRLDIY